MKRTLIVLLALLVLPSVSVMAATTMHTATTDTGNQPYSGVGLVFNVDAASGINVLGLGIYDSAQDGILGQATLSAVIFDSTQAVVAQMDFTSASSGILVGDYLFKTVSSPLVLAQGQYTIVGYGFDADNQEHNMNISGTGPSFDTGAGLISYVGSVWGGGSDAPGVYPTSSGAPDYFSAANMIFEAAAPVAVPVPGALLLGLFGTGLTASIRRKRAL